MALRKIAKPVCLHQYEDNFCKWSICASCSRQSSKLSPFPAWLVTRLPFSGNPTCGCNFRPHALCAPVRCSNTRQWHWMILLAGTGWTNNCSHMANQRTAWDCDDDKTVNPLQGPVFFGSQPQEPVMVPAVEPIVLIGRERPSCPSGVRAARHCRRWCPYTDEHWRAR